MINNMNSQQRLLLFENLLYEYHHIPKCFKQKWQPLFNEAPTVVGSRKYYRNIGRI